jgi:pyridoxal phosphate enzyme (YggS family)
MSEPALSARLAAIRQVVAERQQASGWSHPVRIIAVTKTHGADAVLAATNAGLTDVGENRVQEALDKQAELGRRGADVLWHLIGTLQSNKVRHVPGRFALVHSIDRLDLARELDRRAAGNGATQDVLVQVNCSAESQKGGVDPDQLEILLDAIVALPVLRVRGLMTMAAFTNDESLQRATFARLRSLRDVMEQRGHALPELSMGMSGDYPAAVAEGATMLRLGTVLFGARD